MPSHQHTSGSHALALQAVYVERLEATYVYGPNRMQEAGKDSYERLPRWPSLKEKSEAADDTGVLSVTYFGGDTTRC